MIEKIFNKKCLLSIIIRAEYNENGVNFFTPDNSPLQIGHMKHPSGHVIKPHIHKEQKRETNQTQEVILIKKGKVRVDFYDDSKQYKTSRILKEGDIIFLIEGGHGFELLESVEMIEVKQGPYDSNLDKTRFDTINPDFVNFDNEF